MSMTGTRVSTVLCGLLAVGAAVADDSHADYVKLMRSDPLDGGDSAKMAASSYWNAGGWDDGLFPHADAKYYVAPGQDLVFCYANKNFPVSTNFWRGGELALAGRFVTEVNWDQKYSPVITNLTMLGGSELAIRVLGPFCKNYYGCCTHIDVRSTRTNPAVISAQFRNTGTSNLYLDFNMPFSGDEESTLVLTRPWKNEAGQVLSPNVPFRMCDDATFADFYGTLIFRGANTRTDTNGVCGPSLPNGTLRVEDDAQVIVHNGLVRSARTLPLKGFELDSGTLYVSHGADCPFPTLVVTNAFTLGEHGVVGISLDVPCIRGLHPGETVTRFSEPLAHLTGKAAETASVDPGFRMDFLASPIRTNDFTVGFLDNQDGSKDFCLYATDLVTMTNANKTSGSGVYGAFNGGHAQDFSDNQEPNSESTNHYVCTASLCNNGWAIFAKSRLTVCNGLTWLRGPTIRFKEINFLAGKNVCVQGASYDQSRSLEAEKMRILPMSQGEFRIYSYQDRTLNINAPVEGSSTFILDNIGYSGAANLCGDNSGFHGKLVIRQTDDTASHYTDSPTAFRYQFKSVLSDARNFGGVYTGSDANAAIEISNWPWITVSDDVTFAEPTRTMRIAGGAKFDVAAGKTLTLSNQVTYAGHLVKDGAGMLELGGTARFGDGAAATAPTAGQNELEIAAGALKVSSEAACDGLAITFAEGTRLVVPRHSAKGLHDVRCATPITVNTADGKLPVEVAFEEGTADGEVVICTVSAEAAKSISPETFVGARMKGYALDPVQKRGNADGSVSYVAGFGKKGFCVFVR